MTIKISPNKPELFDGDAAEVKIKIWCESIVATPDPWEGVEDAIAEQTHFYQGEVFQKALEAVKVSAEINLCQDVIDRVEGEKWQNQHFDRGDAPDMWRRALEAIIMSMIWEGLHPYDNHKTEHERTRHFARLLWLKRAMEFLGHRS